MSQTPSLPDEPTVPQKGLWVPPGIFSGHLGTLLGIYECRECCSHSSFSFRFISQERFNGLMLTLLKCRNVSGFLP